MFILTISRVSHGLCFAAFWKVKLELSIHSWSEESMAHWLWWRCSIVFHLQEWNLTSANDKEVGVQQWLLSYYDPLPAGVLIQSKNQIFRFFIFRLSFRFSLIKAENGFCIYSIHTPSGFIMYNLKPQFLMLSK